MNERMKQKPGPCPLGETLPLNQDDVPEQITDKELAEQSALHAEFVAQAEKDPVFMARLARSRAEAKVGKFVDLKKLDSLVDALAGLAEEEKENNGGVT